MVTVEDISAGRVTCDEIAARIMVRIGQLRRDARSKPAPALLKCTRELKTTVKRGGRAPTPFPTIVLHRGVRYRFCSRTEGACRIAHFEAQGPQRDAACEIETRTCSAASVVVSIRVDGECLDAVQGRIPDEKADADTAHARRLTQSVSNPLPETGAVRGAEVPKAGFLG